jgi:paraquat-inducible protein B
MSPQHEDERYARVRPRRWFAWAWAVPIAAAALLVWLAWNALGERGPAITISFKAAQGLQPGQTKIRHRSVDVGTVESVELTTDMSRVLVHARMTRTAAAYLTDTTRFYVVVPRVGFEGVSGLATIVSGTYIEMYPGKSGAPREVFVGLDEPPTLPPEEPGTSFILKAPDLRSVSRGAPIAYNGVDVGYVEGYSLAGDGQSVTLTAFVRAPYDKLVHPETRFWSVSGIELTLGAQGIQVRAGSWQELLVGGLAFETPAVALEGAASPQGAEFDLYENRKAAQRALKGPGLVYIADFPGSVRGIDLGSPVELQGMEVGEVRQADLRYDRARRTLLTQVIFSIDPVKVQILDMPGLQGADRKQEVSDWLEMLVECGLRAQVTDVSFLTGSKLIALEMIPGMKPGRIQRAGALTRIPTAGSADLTGTLRSARELIGHLNAATQGPELTRSLRSLDHTLARLDQLTSQVDPDLQSLIVSLRQTADAAQGTMSSVQGLMGASVPADADVPRLLTEVTRAARAVRELADYLERHPESLLRGRGKDGQ